MSLHFPTDLTSILDRVASVDPVAYAKTRNYGDGAVTRLSPYISRGVISTRQVFESLIERGHSWSSLQKMVQELAWREFYQRLWQSWEDDLFEDILQVRSGVQNRMIPKTILEGKTGIEAIDAGIRKLESTGYMHNHLRMYVASLACNLGRSHWPMPAAWLYYHLLDGDLASNTCSWQWVVGTFNGRKYYCNQRNIDQYFHTRQPGSFLDHSYEVLPRMDVPESLQALTSFDGATTLPNPPAPVLDFRKPLYLYNSYNLDPTWDSHVDANRVLLLEPSHFKRYPVSARVLEFILKLAQNINGIQVFVGEVYALPDIRLFPQVVAKEHPAFGHYPGIKQDREWMFPSIAANHTSFFHYWKKAEQQAKRMMAENAATLSLF